MRLFTTLVDLYSLVVLMAVVMSWIRVDWRNPLGKIVYSLTEPVLAPIRRVLPVMGGLDFSPMVVLLALRGTETAPLSADSPTPCHLA